MRVLVEYRDRDGDWCVGYDAEVLAVTADGGAMKIKRSWWRRAHWLPVKGMFNRLLAVKE